MTPGTTEWLAQVDEDAIDPERVIVDPHHHLWPVGEGLPYGVDDLVADTTSGHRVIQSVFVECHAAYRIDGPEHLRSVGESEFVAASARDLQHRFPNAAPIAGIVAHADLTDDRLDEILDAHEDAADGRLCGFRDALARSIEPEAHSIRGTYAAGKSSDPTFRLGVERLGSRGLPYDSWHYHYQNQDFADLAKAVPDTTMVLDHFGTPVGVGRFAGRHDEVFEQWRIDIAQIAECPNTIAKLGGLAMPDNGFGFDRASAPPTSDELLAVQRRWYEHAIECFGPERCMFESNFPVDRYSLSYGVYWNAMKKLAAQYSESERTEMFSGTARRVYRLPTP
jgi:L-fuconolactonase